MTPNANTHNKQGFHSAVNRIPRLPEKARTMDPRNAHDIYSIHAAATLDHLHLEHLSGYFDLELVAHSPLLIGEQTEDSAKNHWLKVQKVNGEPFISPTMIKGLLSTAYERITSSRFRIFDTDTHSAHLTYRTDPSQSLSLVPVRYTGETDEQERLKFEILNGAPSKDGKPAFIPIKYNKSVLGERYKFKANYIKKFIKQFKHGDHVLFSAYRIKRRWIVTSISKIDHSCPLHVGTFQHREGDKDRQTATEFTGYLYITSTKENLKKNQTNFNKKWAERIFIEAEATDSDIRSQEITCDQSVLERYQATLCSYVTHQEATDILQARRNKDRITNNIFSRMTMEEQTLKKGDLAYALLNADKQISELVPITVGRHAYSHTPNALAEADNVNPARILEEASAADRLFGFVGNNSRNGNALRGRIHIDSVAVSPEAVQEPPKGTDYLLLPPLLSPKPSSGRRFLTPRPDFLNTSNDGTKRSDLFNPKESSLAEAAFPTHRLAIGKSPEEIIALYDSQRNTSKDTDSVRLRVTSWLKTGTTLSCRVSFDDVSPKELAFLLWPLIPQHLSPRDSSKVGYHKMGIGKPLGFGLVEVRIPSNAIYLNSTDTLISEYRALTGVKGTSYRQESALDIIDAAKLDSLASLPWIRAFQRVAYGFDDERPVRYVTLNENRKNNKTDRNGIPLEGCGLAPRPLWLNSSDDDCTDYFKGASNTKGTKSRSSKDRRKNKQNGESRNHARSGNRRGLNKQRGH